MPRSLSPFFAESSLDDLAIWAGETIFQRGLAYHKAGRAYDLALTPEGGLLATVRGTEQYATLFFRDADGQWASACTCPYGARCKHAVAAACAGLTQLASKTPIPPADADDERLIDLERDASPGDSRPEDRPVPKKLKAALEKLSREQLIALVLKAVQLAPDVATLCVAKAEPRSKDVAALVKSARKALGKAMKIPDWGDYWGDSGQGPDYEPVRQKLEALRLAGFTTEVLDLGLELLEGCPSQIEQCGDEGETQDAIAQCLSVVLHALRDADWPLHRKLRWAADALLLDEFSVGECFWDMLDEKHPPEAWNPAADALLRRLAECEGASYSRDRLRDMTVRFLAAAGRDAEVLELYQKEAVRYGDYPQLVQYLLDTRNDPEAEKWLYKGLAATGRTTPDMDDPLRSCLLDLRKRQENWDAVLCMEVEAFVSCASLSQFKACRLGAEKLTVWPVLRPLLMDFLADGKIPWTQKTWPCQDKGNISAPEDRMTPDFYTLIDVAIDEQKPADVLHWYDLQRSAKRGFYDYGYSADRVAGAIQDFAPDRAIDLWKQLVEAQIARVSPKAYVEAAVFLRKMGKLMRKHDKVVQWLAYLESLRTEHRRKIRLMEVLDSLPAD